MWACKRINEEGKSQDFALYCINKYGTPAAALGLGLISRQALKHSEKAVNL